MSKIAIYARVSSQEQTTENQVLRLTEYAQSKGWEYEVYTEVMSTRKTRPIKAELLAKLRKKVYDGILVYKLDRFARSSTELILEISELIHKGISFYSYSENLDFSTATGKLHFQILSAFAEFERSLIAERTKEGLYRAKNNGKILGRPKGSKDQKKRRKSGYILRMARENQAVDEAKGQFKSIHEYLQ
jgi:DNA invertase Pin-like site-specific DNA recombinase